MLNAIDLAKQLGDKTMNSRKQNAPDTTSESCHKISLSEILARSRNGKKIAESLRKARECEKPEAKNPRQSIVT